MKQLLVILFLIPVLAFSQRYSQELTFTGTGDQQISLGRFKIGTVIIITCRVAGGWSEDGGVFHLAADWGNIPKVVFRSESGISERIKFYGYVDPNTNSYAYLFMTWDNQSPGESSTNTIYLTLRSEAPFDVNNVNGVFANGSLLESLLITQSTGKVGIGVTSPSEKLEINGTIRSKEVKVEASPWSDYVFLDDYQLKSLEETETFINEYRHLPGIPSSKEVNENGIALGEMNAKLLEKIEELTLYIIELKKENGTLKQNQDAMNKEIKGIHEKLEKMNHSHY